MARHHVNMLAHTTGECTADIRCPFGDLETEHYPTEALAWAAYAERRKNGEGDDTHSSTSRENMKDMDANELASDLLDRVSKFAKNPKEYSEILEFTSILHAHQKRRNRGRHKTTPYIEHTLRAAGRLVRSGVTDESTIKAAMLHDSIEDGVESYHKYFLGRKAESEEQGRAKLRAFIARRYGAETARIVSSLTNPVEHTPPKDAEEKNRRYYEHLKEAITDDHAVTLGKLSDFIDNAGSLHHTDLPGQEDKTLKQAKKYLPCIHVFREELTKGNSLIDEAATASFQKQLNRVESRLNSIINKYNS